MEQVSSDRKSNSKEGYKAIGLAVAFFLGERAIRNVGAIIDHVLEPSGVPYGLFIILFSLVGAMLYQYLYRKTFDGFMSFKRVWLGFAFVLPSIVVSVFRILRSPSTQQSTAIVIYYVAVAFFEEVAFRGIFGSQIMKTLRDTKHLPLIVVFMGIFFGFAHLHNILMGQAVFETILQVISATIIGLLYALSFVLTGSIWPTVADHFLHNFMCSMYVSEIVTEEISTSELIPGLVTYLGCLALAMLCTILITSRPNIQNYVSDLWAEKWQRGFCNAYRKSQALQEKRGLLKTGCCSLIALAVFTAGISFVNSNISTGYISNLLGERGYYIDSTVIGNYRVRTYYQGKRLSKNKKLVAMTAGSRGDIGQYSVDIDDDGINELICEGYLITNENEYGAHSLIVYKQSEGKVLVGTVPFVKLGMVNDVGDCRNLYAVYDEENQSIEVSYGTLSDIYTKDNVNIDFSNIEYAEFNMNLQQ